MLDVVLLRRQPRLCALLEHALKGVAHRFVPPGAALRDRRVLLAAAVDEGGMDGQTLRFLRRLRTEPDAMRGSIAAVLVDGTGELYTKQVAQELVYAANRAGCLFPGKPALEGTGSLYNQHILAQRRGMSLEETYFCRARELVQRLAAFVPPRFANPRLLVLHASERGRSSTLWLWDQLRPKLDPAIVSCEVTLQNGTVHDCRGCSYRTCLHFAQNGSCFYGGALSETVLPAIRDCDAMLFLCPNYNDAVSANVTALFNRLTSLLLRGDLHQKYLFGMVVSGYSGSDLVARQLLGAMCLNKTAMLPPQFCLTETANDLAAMQALPHIPAKLDAFAQCMERALLPTVESDKNQGGDS